MITNLKPYPAYKDSELPWLGHVPEHWELAPNRSLMRIRKKLVGERHGAFTLLSLTKLGVIVRDITEMRGKFSSDPGTSQEVRKGDLVMCLFDVPETPRTVGLSGHAGMITGAYTVMECRRPESAKFLELFYIAMDDRKLLSPLYSGLRNTIPKERLLGTKTPLPPPSEQAAIVRFLDWANGRLERAIRAKRKIITLLNEQKQAIIHQAVTRGLDPSVRLKPSGIPWLGEIPEHWEVRRLKTLGTKFGSGVTPRGGASVYQDEGVPFLRSQNIHFGGLRLEGVARISADIHRQMAGTHVRPNDVLLNITGASIGRVCAVPEGCGEANVNQHVCIIRPIRSRCDSSYLALFLSTTAAQTAIVVAQNGSSREGLSVSSVKALPILLPPLSEQHSIQQRLQADTQPLDSAISRLEREITLLREYRTRLVADVVTGKLDVREAAERLPAEEAIDTSEDAAEFIDEVETVDEEITE